MKKILMSVLAIGVVGAAVAYGTGAFFSDTETSTGNTFTSGAIDLKIDSTAHYNGLVCQGSLANGYFWQWENPAPSPLPNDSYILGLVGKSCAGSWELTDIGTILQKSFFNYADIKPGDMGENTISLHVDNNDAWSCAKITLTANAENTCTEPELEQDPSCVADAGTGFNGDLAQNVSMLWWPDNGDNILSAQEQANAFFMPGVKLSNVLTNNQVFLTLADSKQNFFEPGNNATPVPNKPLIGGTTTPYYFGVGWCLGDITLTPDQGRGFSCNGGPVLNDVQTDSIKADIEFSVVQSRNNATFRCVDSFRP